MQTGGKAGEWARSLPVGFDHADGLLPFVLADARIVGAGLSVVVLVQGG